MSDDSRDPDADIIRASYSDKVKEAFLSFADNLTVGQSEKSCKERFVRSLLLVKRARDLALEAISGMDGVDLEAAAAELAAADAGRSGATLAEALSAEDQAMIEHALSGTTGVAKPVRLR
jgi:hypothetical protein